MCWYHNCNEEELVCGVLQAATARVTAFRSPTRRLWAGALSKSARSWALCCVRRAPRRATRQRNRGAWTRRIAGAARRRRWRSPCWARSPAAPLFPWRAWQGRRRPAARVNGRRPPWPWAPPWWCRSPSAAGEGAEDLAAMAETRAPGTMRRLLRRLRWAGASRGSPARARCRGSCPAAWAAAAARAFASRMRKPKPRLRARAQRTTAPDARREIAISR